MGQSLNQLVAAVFARRQLWLLFLTGFTGLVIRPKST